MNIAERNEFKQRALQWASQFDTCCCYDSHNYTDPYSKYDFLLAVGTERKLSAVAGNAFNALKEFSKESEWIFGMFGYDLKNELENLKTPHPNHTGFPDLFFFVPRYIICIKNNETRILKGPEDLLNTINRFSSFEPSNHQIPDIQRKMDKATYLNKVEALREHILAGDIYEATFCQEFFAENASIDPYTVYQNLREVSPTPFSGFFKLEKQYILSASPERFLCKRGSQLYSQPIKGTAKRSADPNEDKLIREALLNSEKERAENVMIVDLVRNDMTKSALRGSVRVDELFGIYSFPQVHQMISTISCEIEKELHPVDAVKNTFPPGSMTGAPKLRAMQLINETELSRRGIYAGAIGYFEPDGDFDFNVVIRSLVYNGETGYLSFQVGGAITYASSAEAEYEECLLKASALLKTLKGSAKH